LHALNRQISQEHDSEAEGDATDYEAEEASSLQADFSGKSFRVAAFIVVAGLALLSLAGLYTFYVNATRKPASVAARPATKPTVSTPETAFIPTPEAARDYEEESSTPSDVAAPDTSEEGRKENRSLNALASATPGHAPHNISDRYPQPIERQRPTIPSPSSAQMNPSQAKRAAATDLVLPRGTYGLVDARLVRVRSRQTNSGMRYDLTFNLQEQAGRTTQYERLAIVTRSASGVNHSEAVPFYHRLGAAGTLTFTISVEMRGRAQTDWQGRIVCTGIGTDGQGKPLRTSFGASVSP
jgi:cytoskeletal protein RodZ